MFRLFPLSACLMGMIDATLPLSASPWERYGLPGLLIAAMLVAAGVIWKQQVKHEERLTEQYDKMVIRQTDLVATNTAAMARMADLQEMLLRQMQNQPTMQCPFSPEQIRRLIGN